MNYGFKEPTITSSDFWLGSGKIGTTEINPSGDWRPFLPELEIQRINFETQACVSFGTLSALEMIHKLLYKAEPNYSDRFLAKASDTDPNGGNTPNKVSDTIKNKGAVPEKDYPMVSTLEEYYQDIPLAIYITAKTWTKNFDFGYEWVDKNNLKEALKRSPVGVAVDAWNQNDKGEYIRLGQSNHWVVCVAFDGLDRPIIWDSYDNGLKVLEKGYDLQFSQIYTIKKKPTAKNQNTKKEIG